MFCDVSTRAYQKPLTDLLKAIDFYQRIESFQTANLRICLGMNSSAKCSLSTCISMLKSFFFCFKLCWKCLLLSMLCWCCDVLFYVLLVWWCFVKYSVGGVLFCLILCWLCGALLYVILVVCCFVYILLVVWCFVLCSFDGVMFCFMFCWSCGVLF